MRNTTFVLAALLACAVTVRGWSVESVAASSSPSGSGSSGSGSSGSGSGSSSGGSGSGSSGMGTNPLGELHHLCPKELMSCQMVETCNTFLLATVNADGPPSVEAAAAVGYEAMTLLECYMEAAPTEAPTEAPVVGPSDEEMAAMNAAEAEDSAQFWRETAWNSLLQARAATAAMEKATSDGEYKVLAAVAKAAGQAASAAQAAREQAEANAASKEKGAVEAQTALECALTKGGSIDCLLSEWSVAQDGCAAQVEANECDRGGVVRSTRSVSVQPMCGGGACGPLHMIEQCPPAPACVFRKPQVSRLVYVLNGVNGATYDDNAAEVNAAIKAFYRLNVFGVDGPKFKLKPVSVNGVATPTAQAVGQEVEAGSAAIKRHRRLAAADSDTELEFDLETDAAEVSSDEVSSSLADASNGFKEILETVPDVAEVLTNVFVETNECSADESACEAKQCGWVVDSCGEQRQCGTCGFNPECGAAMQLCLTGGDCSAMGEYMDEAKTLDGCLTDVSQLV